jgi:phosphoenolpyruvate carboxykinase (ATP)
LINTGWIGGPFGTGRRIPLHYNRVTVAEILSGRMDHVPGVVDPVFGFLIPQRCGDMPPELLTGRYTWKDPKDYDAQARELAGRFIKNFKPFAATTPELVAGGPKV